MPTALRPLDVFSGVVPAAVEVEAPPPLLPPVPGEAAAADPALPVLERAHEDPLWEPRPPHTPPPRSLDGGSRRDGLLLLREEEDESEGGKDMDGEVVEEVEEENGDEAEWRR